MNTTKQILVIEDDSVDFRVIERALSKTPHFKLCWVETIAAGIKALKDNSIDLILLDLTLPDNHGVDAISQLSGDFSVPIVVLTGLDDEPTSYQSIQYGAQDFLVKGKFDNTLLVKTIRYAMERHNLLHELNKSKLAIQRERELRRLDLSLSSSSESDTLYSQELGPLKSTKPETFTQLTREYRTVFNLAIEQRVFKVEYDVSKQLQSLANVLGNNNASPRDVVELHTTALAFITKDAPLKKTAVYNEEGRYLLTGLLGHLCSYYRKRCESLHFKQIAQ